MTPEQERSMSRAIRVIQASTIVIGVCTIAELVVLLARLLK